MQTSWKVYAVAVMGICLILVGIVCNVWAAGRFLTQDGSLSMVGSVVVWLFDLGAVAFGSALLWFRVRIAERLHFSKTALLAWTIVAVVLFGLLEVTSRIIDAAYENNFSGERERLQTADIIPWRVFGWDQYEFEDGKRLIVDSNGNHFPYEKDPGTVRIITFGGSTTYQSALGSKHYPGLLQEALQREYPNRTIEVINVANVGYTTAHSLTLLQFDVLSWDPDMVIFSHNINDLIAGYTERFAPDYSELFSLPDYTRGKSGAARITRSLFGWSTFYWIVDQQFVRVGGPLIKKALGLSVYNERSYGMEPRKEAEEVFRRNLELFADTALARGITVIFGTQPFEPSRMYWDRTMQFHGANYALIYPQHKEIVAHHAVYNDIIRHVAQSRGVYLVDNARRFEGESAYFTDHVHYTANGLRALAGNFFDLFVSQNIIKP